MKACNSTINNNSFNSVDPQPSWGTLEIRLINNNRDFVLKNTFKTKEGKTFCYFKTGDVGSLMHLLIERNHKLRCERIKASLYGRLTEYDDIKKKFSQNYKVIGFLKNTLKK